MLYVLAFGNGVTERMQQINNYLYHDCSDKVLYGFVLPLLSMATKTV